MNKYIEYRSENLEDLITKTATDLKIPVQGEIEITNRCNCNCIHCFIDRQNPSKIDLSLFKSICDQLRNSGCIRLLITGGEPLMHPDFFEIWTYAHRKGINLTLFTNGTLLSDDHLNLFSKYQPEKVEISIYSLKKSAYQKITKSKVDVNELLKWVIKLSQLTKNVTIKTPLLTVNHKEINEIQEFAKNNGLGFRMDAMILPTLRNSLEPTKYRLPVNKAANIIMNDSEFRFQYKTSFKNSITPFKDENRLFSCSAGVYSFHIDHSAKLNMCSLYRNAVADISRVSFFEGWERLKEVRKMTTGEKRKCDNCQLKSICTHCPAIPLLYGADVNYIDRFMCDYTYKIAALTGIAEITENSV